MRNDGVGAAAAGYAGASAGAGADGGDDAGAGGAAAGVGADAGAVHADANGQLLNCVAVLAQHGLAAESVLVWFCFGAGINHATGLVRLQISMSICLGGHPPRWTRLPL